MPAKTPDDYLKEMMELYKRSNFKHEPKQKPEPKSIPISASVSQPAATPVVPEPIPEPIPEPAVEPIKEEKPEPAPDPKPKAEPEPMPKPLPLPELPPEMVSETIIENKPIDNKPIENDNNTSFGWIQVSARTAGNALPLEGVSVLILKDNGMDTDLITSLVTDQSGNTPKIKLPAPPRGSDPSQAYSTYQIRAFLPGYTRMESASVPVFSGVTSIQPFELIPLPVGSDGNEPAIINQNTEPKF